MNNKRTVLKVLIGSLIVLLGVSIIYQYTQKDSTKTEVLQAAIDSEQDNVEDKSPEQVNDDEDKDKDDVSFDAGKIQDFFVNNVRIEDGKKIAFLTFDDGPSTTVTPKILKILKDNNIKATFFIVGDKLEESPEAKKYF